MDIKTDNNMPRLVITGLITTDTAIHKIYVSRTVQYLGNEATKYYLDGVVKLNNTDLKADDSFNAYITTPDFYGIPGETYKLDVWVDFDEDGEPEHYASAVVMPEFIPLDSIYLGSMSVTHPLGPPWMLFVAFQDPVGPNYYGAGLHINQFNYSWTLAQYFINNFNSSVEDGRYIKFPVYYIEDELEFRNSDDKLPLKPGDTLTLALNNMSQGYYDFVKAAKQEIDGGGSPLFAGPPANVPSNISNGALGVFGAYTISRKQICLPETPTFPKKESGINHKDNKFSVLKFNGKLRSFGFV
jgi:hypothetical protein